MRLLLFDIDGTLLHSGGAGRRAVARTFQTLFGTIGATREVQMAGMTDPLIAHACLAAIGYEAHDIDARLPEVWAHYPGYLAEELDQQPATLCPGVLPLLTHLATRDDLVLALLTGNIEPCAWLKLRSAGIDHFFSFGAFGNEGPERHKLPAVAIAKAAHAVGWHFQGEDVVIIGDTPHDIACGRHLGVRAVAVCTGPYCADDLQGADVVLPSLAETEQVIAALLG